MKTIKGPAVYLAQFSSEEAPFNNFKSICQWASKLGYKGVQLPAWDTKIIDVEKAAKSHDYCDELKGIAKENNLVITDMASHIQGQLIAVHPAYDDMFDGFAPPQFRNNPKKRTAWAIQQMEYCAMASKNLGVKTHGTFSGALLWHTIHPWPQRPDGLVELGFKELAKRWTPILDVFEENGIDLCYEIHPGEDLHDGITFERFLEATQHHNRAKILYDPSHFVLQQLNYLDFIDIYKDYISMFHVKDAEFNSSGRSGVFGGYQGWKDRAGRYRSLGDGQIDFKSIFSKLTQYNLDLWAVMEWECCIKSPEQGATEGAPFIQNHIIEVTQKNFDDFASGKTDQTQLKKILGIQ